MRRITLKSLKKMGCQAKARRLKRGLGTSVIKLMIRLLYDRRERVVVANPKMPNKTSIEKPFFSLFSAYFTYWIGLGIDLLRLSWDFALHNETASNFFGFLGRISLCIPYACLFILWVMTNIHEWEELGYVACYIYAVNGVEGQARASKLLYRLSWFTRSSACVQYMSALLLLHWQKFKTASSRKLGQC